MSTIRLILITGLFAISILAATVSNAETTAELTHDDLLQLFADWREFESPPLLDGAPDYTAERFVSRRDDFDALRMRLQSFETGNWPIDKQVDWHLVRAEMNGYDFNQRILQPWVRDPAFYQTMWNNRSDVPAHEGPTHHAVVEVWTYDFPLSDAEEQRLISELSVVPALMQQAKLNLTGNARDLWVTGIRDIRAQRASLDALGDRLGNSAGAALVNIIAASKVATDELVAWLEAEADSKTGPSGIGKENYTWYQQNVHLLPMTWEDEVRLLERELARAWSSLKLEEQRNRHLPLMVAASGGFVALRV